MCLPFKHFFASKVNLSFCMRSNDLSQAPVLEDSINTHYLNSIELMFFTLCVYFLFFTFHFIFFLHITVLWLHLGFICTTKLGGVLLIRALFPTMTVTGTTKTLFQTLALFFSTASGAFTSDCCK